MKITDSQWKMDLPSSVEETGLYKCQRSDCCCKNVNTKLNSQGLVTVIFRSNVEFLIPSMPFS